MGAAATDIRAVIPARYGSTRLPGKPLADINGKPLIQHVYDEIASVLDHVVVATDDDRIQSAVEGFGGQVYRSTASHDNGTSRTAATAKALGWQDADFIINIQGDEAMITANVIRDLSEALSSTDEGIATLMTPVLDDAVLDIPGQAFIALDAHGCAMYFSRYPIPYLQGVPRDERLAHGRFFKHIGIYAYRPDVLQAVAQLPPTYAEQAESLEQNRWLAHGHKVRMVETDFVGRSVDDAADLEFVRVALANRQL